jgi:hypothetical protein
LFFEQNGKDEERKFIWVETQARMSGGKMLGHSGLPKLGKWLGGRKRRSTLHTLNDRTIEIWEVEENDCKDAGVSELIEGGWDSSMWDDACPDHFGASLVIMGVGTVAEDGFVSSYRDLTLDDFRVASHCFLEDSYLFEVDNDEGRFPLLIFSQPKWLEAVQISNAGEMKERNRAQYRRMMLNKDHAEINWHDDTSEITERMGITLLFRKCPSIVKTNYFAKEPFKLNANPAAFYLLLGADTSDEYEHWGQSQFPKYDNGNDPSFIVFREDKKGITTHQVEALSEYCRNVMFDALLDEDGTWDQRKKEEVLDFYCSAQKFTKFFEKFKQEKIQGGDRSWVDATVPVGMRRHTWKEGSDRASKRKREASPTPTGIAEGVDERLAVIEEEC